MIKRGAVLSALPRDRTRMEHGIVTAPVRSARAGMASRLHAETLGDHGTVPARCGVDRVAPLTPLRRRIAEWCLIVSLSIAQQPRVSGRDVTFALATAA
jgi:hypothetical protein